MDCLVLPVCLLRKRSMRSQLCYRSLKSEEEDAQSQSEWLDTLVAKQQKKEPKQWLFRVANKSPSYPTPPCAILSLLFIMLRRLPLRNREFGISVYDKERSVSGIAVMDPTLRQISAA
ncbi:hypothetical protein V6N12_060169 [Hibiscus sabdariffa]|uniref:Uncharacterized protein n=1 Tax=Hibiscus sabdariffa TaxID=183260 RepID=A0ABR2D6F0_9ROSI